jgi:hypothetical protein
MIGHPRQTTADVKAMSKTAHGDSKGSRDKASRELIRRIPVPLLAVPRTIGPRG